MPKFAIVAINAQSGIPGLMGYAETMQDAIAIQDRATRTGWLVATICDSPQQVHEFGEAARIQP